MKSFIVRRNIDPPVASKWEVVPRFPSSPTEYHAERQVFTSRKEARLYCACRNATCSFAEAGNLYVNTP